MPTTLLGAVGDKFSKEGGGTAKGENGVGERYDDEGSGGSEGREGRGSRGGVNGLKTIVGEGVDVRFFVAGGIASEGDVVHVECIRGVSV